MVLNGFCVVVVHLSLRIECTCVVESSRGVVVIHPALLVEFLVVHHGRSVVVVLLSL